MSTYTKAQRARIAADFRQAKKNLWGGTGRIGSKPYFICLALETCEARRVIQTRLGGCVTVTTWLRKKGYLGAYNPSIAKLQRYRAAWLDELIKEFSDAT